jgi:hypothetical protein
MNQRPAGITVISIIVAFQGVLAILLGLEAARITSLGLGAASGSEAAGLADIVLGIITVLVSYGLFMTQGWAWLVAVVVTLIRVVTGVLGIVLSGFGSTIGLGGLVAVVIGAVILWYFTRPNIKAAFGR